MSKRRNLLALIGIVVLLLSLSVPVMQCAPAAEEEVTPPEEEVTPPEEEEEEEIKYGGRMNVGFTAAIDSLNMDMSLQWTNWGCLLNMIVYDNLAHYGIAPDTYTFHPKLVRSYDVSEDGTTWTMHLAENAKWHDGVPFTAEDLAFKFEYLDQKTPGWGKPQKVFEEIEIIDDYTIRVVHDIPLTTAHVPNWWLWDSVIPKHIFEPYKDDILSFANEEAIGTGPFKLQEFEPGQYMWLEAYEDYFDGRPYVDELIFKYYGNTEAMLMALQSGEVDVFGNLSVPVHAIEDIKANPNIKVETVPGIEEIILAFNLHTDGPLQNKDVRHAIAYGIDRDRIIDMAYAGYAESCDGYIYPESQMHNPDLPQYDYNPDKANEILDGAGYLDTDGDGIRNDPATGENLVFSLATSSAFQPQVKICTLINEMLPAIGIKTELTVMDRDTFSDYYYRPMDDLLEMMVNSTSPSPDPWSDWVWRNQVSWGSGGDWWNATYYDNPRFNELWVNSSCAKGLEAKKEILYEMQEILTEDLPLYFLARPEYISAYRTDKFEGWVQEIGGPVSWLNDWSFLKAHLK